MLRERIALIYDLLTLGDDLFDVKEIVGLGNSSKRYDREADNRALHEYLAETIDYLEAKGLLLVSVGSSSFTDPSTPKGRISTKERILQYLNNELGSVVTSVGVMVTPKGEALLASLIDLKQPA